MSALRTDYKDDIFEGSRKYSQIVNPDNTISFSDQTDYLQHGDTFGAAEINLIDATINEKGLTVSSSPIAVADRLPNQLYFFYTQG